MFVFRFLCCCPTCRFVKLVAFATSLQGVSSSPSVEPEEGVAWPQEVEWANGEVGSEAEFDVRPSGDMHDTHP